MLKQTLFCSLIYKAVRFNNENPELKTLTITQQTDFSSDTLNLIISENYNKIIIDSASVSIPNFEGFHYISELEIKVTASSSIPRSAFRLNGKIKKVSLTSNIKVIGECAFANSTLQTINLENVDTIYKNAFEGCAHLTNVKLDKQNKNYIFKIRYQRIKY